MDDEAVFHVALHQTIISLVNLLDGDEFDVGSDVVLGGEIQHLPGFVQATNGGATEIATPKDKTAGLGGRAVLGALLFSARPCGKPHSKESGLAHRGGRVRGVACRRVPTGRWNFVVHQSLLS